MLLGFRMGIQIWAEPYWGSPSVELCRIHSLSTPQSSPGIKREKIWMIDPLIHPQFIHIWHIIRYCKHIITKTSRLLSYNHHHIHPEISSHLLCSFMPLVPGKLCRGKGGSSISHFQKDVNILRTKRTVSEKNWTDQKIFQYFVNIKLKHCNHVSNVSIMFRCFNVQFTLQFLGVLHFLLDLHLSFGHMTWTCSVNSVNCLSKSIEIYAYYA